MSTKTETAQWTKNGNLKLGESIWSFNTLAGCGLINGTKGTCKKEYCTGCYNAEDPKKSNCYVFKSYARYGWDHSSVVKGHIRNTEAMRTDLTKAFEDLNKQIQRARKKPTSCRIHSSGEIETADELKGWMNIATKNPTIPFYVYTKAYDVVDEVLGKEKLTIPSNFFLNISIWHTNGISCYLKYKTLDNVRAFVYDDGYDYTKEGLKINCHCPAYDKNGKMNHDYTCDKCGICYNKKAKICGCYDH